MNWVVVCLCLQLSKLGFFLLGPYFFGYVLVQVCGYCLFVSMMDFLFVLKLIGIFFWNVKFKDDDGDTFPTKGETH